jgi:hypothetical protein
MMAALLFAAFLGAHALIHASYLSPRPAPKAGAPAWPFDLERSRLLAAAGLRGTLPRSLGVALVALTVAGFGLAALAAAGFAPDALFALGIGGGSIASLALLGICFHPWLSLGIAIDLVLLWAAFVAGWAPPGSWR